MTNYVQRTWLTIGIAVAVVGGAWLLASLFQGLLIVLAGVLFGIFLGQLSRSLASVTSLRYSWAFVAVVALLVILAVAAIFLMGSQIATKVDQFIEQFNQAKDQLVSQLKNYGWWSQITGSDNGNGQAPTLPRGALSTAGSAVSATMTAIGGAVLVLFLGCYFAAQPDLYRRGLITLFADRYQQRVDEILDRIAHTLWHWILGRLAGMVIIATSSAIGLAALGVPLPISLGVLAGLLTFIPNVGPFLAAIPPAMFALQQGGHLALYVLALYAALQFVESYFLTPLIMQRQVDIPPGLTLSAQLLFGLLGGFLGLFLATPIVVMLRLLVQEVYLGDVLGHRPDRTAS